MPDKEGFHTPVELFELAHQHGAMDDAEHEVAIALAEAESAARVDVLTNLPNERAFWEQLKVAAARAEREKETFCVASIDLVGLKGWNANSHSEGDKALKYLAEAFRQSARDTDRLFRLEGDQFAAIFEDAVDPMRPLQATKDLLDSPAYAINGRNVGFYMGINRYIPEVAEGPVRETTVEAKRMEVYAESQKGLSFDKKIRKSNA